MLLLLICPVWSCAPKLTRRSAIGPPDDPEDPLPEAPGERGGGGGEQEGGAVPQRPERAGRGEGDEQPAAEAAARPAPADKVRALTHTHTHINTNIYKQLPPTEVKQALNVCLLWIFIDCLLNDASVVDMM